MAKHHQTPKSFDLSRLRPNPKNPRKVDKKRLDMLMQAMQTFGDLGGVVFNRRSGHLVGGHQRTAVFQKFAKECRVEITKSYDTPTEFGTIAEGIVNFRGAAFAYRETDWPQEVEQAANIAANRGAGTFDIPLLKDAIVELDALNVPLDLTMFQQDELDKLFGEVSVDEGEEQAPAQEGQLGVKVTCKDADEQQRVLDWCMAENIVCKPTMP